jgi:catechol 2,3-dioxygenase-like lactoylglutathione lyase family enzyme
MKTDWINFGLFKKINMKIGHIELFVSNPLESLKFYRDVLDFELVENQGDKFIWVKSGDVLILFRPGKNSDTRNEKGNNYQESSFGLVLYTDNLDESSKKLKERGLVFKGTDGSDKCLTFTDPDGNWFQLVNPNEH